MHAWNVLPAALPGGQKLEVASAHAASLLAWPCLALPPAPPPVCASPPCLGYAWVPGLQHTHTHTPLLEMSSHPPIPPQVLFSPDKLICHVYCREGWRQQGRAMTRPSLSCTMQTEQFVKYMHAETQCRLSQVTLLLDRIGRGLEKEVYGGESPAASFTHIGYAQQQRTRTVP